MSPNSDNLTGYDDCEIVDITPSAPSAVHKPINVQLYENSPLSGSTIERDHKANPNALYNVKKPNLAIIHEKPEHRIALYLKASGKSNKEIAQRMGWTDAWVSQLMRQPWAQERLVEEIRAAGQDEISSILKGAAADSVFTLIEVRDSATSKGSDKVTAANSLLDRFFGKPTQRVESFNTNRTAQSEDPAEIDRRIRALEAEEKRLTGAAVTSTT